MIGSLLLPLTLLGSGPSGLTQPGSASPVNPSLHFVAPPAQDAIEDALHALRELIEKDDYFRGVQWELVHAGDGIVYVVQAPLKPVVDYAAMEAEKVELALQPVARHFVAEYARPFGLERSERQLLVPVLVLPTRGTFDDYTRVKVNDFEACYGSSFGFDRVLCAPVLYVDRGNGRWKPAELRRQAGGPLALALLQAVRGERTSSYRWYAQGLSAHVSRQLPGDDGRLAPRPLSASIASGIKRLFQDGQAPIEWHSVNDLLRVEGWGYLSRMVQSRARRAAVARPGGMEILRSYGRACLAFTMFLDDGPHRAGYRKFLAGAMRGKNDAGALLEALEFASVQELDAAFRIWLSDAIGYEVPPLEAIATLVDDPEPEGAAVEEAAAPAAAAISSPFLLLAVRGEDEGLDLSLAVALAARGRVDEASTMLESAGGEQAESLRGWLGAWRELRDSYLAQLVESGDEVRLEVDGEKERLWLVSYASGQLVVSTRSGDERTFPLEAFDGAPLALAMGTKAAEVLVEGGGWKRGIPLALAGHDRTRRTLRGVGEEGDALLEASTGWLAEARERGAAALVLEDLANLPEEIEPQEATAAVESLGAIAARLTEDPVLQGKLEAAKSAARRLFEVVLSGQGAEELLAAEIKRSPGADGRPDRLSIEWDFSNPVHSADLREFPELEWRTNRIWELARPEDEWKREQRKKHVLLMGKHTYYFPVAVEPPFRIWIDYSTHWDQSMPGLGNINTVGFASEDGKHFLYANNGWYVEWAIKRQTDVVEATDAPQNQAKGSYEIELSFDGNEVVHHFAGIEVARFELADFPDPSAGPFLPMVAVSNDLEFQLKRIRIEGIDAGTLPSAESDAWVERRLGLLFPQ